MKDKLIGFGFGFNSPARSFQFDLEMNINIYCMQYIIATSWAPFCIIEALQHVMDNKNPHGELSYLFKARPL